MALYTELPIYRTSYELLKKVNVRIKTFPRDFKFTQCIDLVLDIYRANSTEDKEFTTT